MFTSQIRLIAPVPDTAARPFGAAGGNVSFGVTQIGADGSLSIVAFSTVATLRTTKHCSFPDSAPACAKLVTVSGVSFNGAGADAAAPASWPPAAGAG